MKPADIAEGHRLLEAYHDANEAARYSNETTNELRSARSRLHCFLRDHAAELLDAAERDIKAANGDWKSPDVPTLDDDTANIIGSDISHDARLDDNGLDRVRWNNRTMAMVLASRNKLNNELDITNGCLNMIADTLNKMECHHHAGSHDATPAIMYPEWITCVVSKTVETITAERDQLKAENTKLQEEIRTVTQPTKSM